MYILFGRRKKQERRTPVIDEYQHFISYLWKSFIDTSLWLLFSHLHNPVIKKKQNRVNDSNNKDTFTHIPEKIPLSEPEIIII